MEGRTDENNYGKAKKEHEGGKVRTEVREEAEKT
jgi:hypothetical protein